MALKGALVMPAMGASPTGGQMGCGPSWSGANSPGLSQVDEKRLGPGLGLQRRGAVWEHGGVR